MNMHRCVLRRFSMKHRSCVRNILPVERNEEAGVLFRMFSLYIQNQSKPAGPSVQNLFITFTNHDGNTFTPPFFHHVAVNVKGVEGVLEV